MHVEKLMSTLTDNKAIINLLKLKELLIVAPHFEAFIKDQAKLIRPYFKKMNILIPIPYLSRVVLSLPLLKKYFSFLEITLQSDEKSGKFDLTFAKYFTLPIEIMRKRNYYFASKSCLKKLGQNMRFDLIHAHFLGVSGYVGAILKHRYDKPLILTAHGGDVYDLPFRDEWHQALARYVLNKADRIITVSQFNAEKLLSLGVSSNKLRIIPNGYDEKLFKPIPLHVARKKLGLPINKKVLLSVGNLVNVKGHTYLVDAMQFVLKKRKDIILIIIGSGPLKERLRKKASNLGLNGKILFAGRKKHNEIPIWMNASDLFVMPSLSEGFPTVIPEAIACGKPVIGTKVGGIPEIITNQEVGLLVNPKDSEKLALAIVNALNKTWSSEAILNHAKQYSWDTLVPQIISVYNEVL